MNEPRSPRSAASVQGNAAAQGSADKPPRRKPPTSMVVATWAVRACFAFVFAVNVQCALGFALTPEAYLGAYELAGVPGRVAAQGIGVAFLMWNCTYPLVIWKPQRHTTLAGVVLAQQVVGLIGEAATRRSRFARQQHQPVHRLRCRGASAHGRLVCRVSLHKEFAQQTPRDRLLS